MKNYKAIIKTISLSAFVWFALSSANVFAENIIYPGDSNWNLITLGDGKAEITGENPRSGNGSLALSTNSLDDWAFYSRYAGDINTDSWGKLSDIDALSFDWFREDIGITDTYGSPWLAQTPVIRLLIRDVNSTYGSTIYSELVWEKFYTDPTPSSNNVWVEQNMIGENFWRHVFNEGYTIENDGTNLNDFTGYALMSNTLTQWTTASVDLPYSLDAVIYGLSVGVGSYWPTDYKGYADNIFLSFKGTGSVIDDNFEIPAVPEPATILLLGSGLVALAVRRKRLLKG
jgi:hypothetical protein